MTCAPPIFPSPARFRRQDASAIVGEQVTSPPVDYPITVAQAKKQVELPAEDTAHDDHLERLIAAATRFLQDQTGRQFVLASFTFGYDQFPPGCEPLWIPRPPLVEVTSISYLDTEGNVQAMSAADYLVATDCQPGRVSLARLGSGSWPTPIRQGRAVTIEADCGYATPDDVPEDVKLCLLWLVDDWFNGRSGQDEAGGQAKGLLESLRLGDDFLQYAPAYGDPAYVGFR